MFDVRVGASEALSILGGSGMFMSRQLWCWTDACSAESQESVKAAIPQLVALLLDSDFGLDTDIGPVVTDTVLNLAGYGVYEY